MSSVQVRKMTQPEFDRWQMAIAVAYADEQVTAGRWDESGAVQKALDENALILPQGLDTPRMLLLWAVTAEDSPIGRAWVGLDHPRGAPDTAFLYDIEVNEEFRGQGFGRALLDAVENAVRQSGLGALELNVFGPNTAAIRLYESNGYSVTTQQMKKQL